MIKQIATTICLFACIAPVLADDEKDKETHAKTPSSVLESLPAEEDVRAPIVGLLLAGFTLEHLGTILIVIGMLAFAHWRARRSGRPF